MLSRKLVGTLSLAAASCVLWAGTAQATVNIPLVPVGDVGNAADTTGYGAVSYAYNIGKYEVTAGQYTEFLNAVAATDTYALYNTTMANLAYGSGIERSGSSGSYTYSVDGALINNPVNYVSFWDACRFTNWLQNNQPTNVGQVAGTTETGAYDLTVPGAISGNTATRSPGASWAVTSEYEWYKAAYYKGGSTNAGYWLYPTQNNTAPGQDLNDTSGNNANYSVVVPVGFSNTTMVGQFQNSESAYNTFDQAGNVWEWNDTVTSGSYRALRGGAYLSSYFDLQSGMRWYGPPTYEYSYIGFRVSRVPAPSLQLTSAGSYKVHGSAGTFAIPLPLTGEPGVECRSSGGAHTLAFIFNNSVASGNASVTGGTGSVSGSPIFSGNVMTVNFAGVADVQKLTVTLSGVTDSFAQVLPNTAVSMNVLAGDTSGNKTVNASDVGQAKAQSGVPVTSANFRNDVTPTGTINASDIGLVKSHSGQSVP